MAAKTNYLRSLINGEQSRVNRKLADLGNAANAAFIGSNKRLDARDELGLDPDPANVPAFYSGVEQALAAVGLTPSKDLDTVLAELAAEPAIDSGE